MEISFVTNVHKGTIRHSPSGAWKREGKMLEQSFTKIRMTKGKSRRNRNKWSKQKSTNVINFIEIFLCHMKRIQLWNQEKAALKMALRFTQHPTHTPHLTRRHFCAQMKAFPLFFLEKKLCVISMEIRITLFRTCFGFLLPSIGLDFGDGSDSRKAFARCCSTKRFQIWIEWINNAETMRTWHFSSPFSNCDWKKNEKVSRSKLSYFFRDCLLESSKKKGLYWGGKRILLNLSKTKWNNICTPQTARRARRRRDANGKSFPQMKNPTESLAHCVPPSSFLLSRTARKFSKWLLFMIVWRRFDWHVL